MLLKCKNQMNGSNFLDFSSKVWDLRLVFVFADCQINETAWQLKCLTVTQLSKAITALRTCFSNMPIAWRNTGDCEVWRRPLYNITTRKRLEHQTAKPPTYRNRRRWTRLRDTWRAFTRAYFSNALISRPAQLRRLQRSLMQASFRHWSQLGTAGKLKSPNWKTLPSQWQWSQTQ